MKKTILALLLVAAVATVVVVSCTEKISEFNKGQDAAKAFCDCVKNAKSDLSKAACLVLIEEDKKLDFENLSKGNLSEYQTGWVIAGNACLQELNN